MVYRSYEKTIWDVSTPNWRDKGLSQPVVNPVTINEATLSSGGGFMSGTHTSGDRWTFDCANGSLARLYFGAIEPTFVFDDRDSCIALAKTKALANIDKTPYDFLEDLATIRQTTATLLNPLEGFKNAALNYEKAVRRGKSKGLSSAQAVADAWLHGRMAIRPLAGSISSLIEYANTRLSRQYGVRRAVGVHTLSRMSSDNIDGTVVKKHDTDQNSSARAGIYYQCSRAKDSLDDLGISSHKLPRLAWDLTPYSWAIDYFTNVGTSISALVNILDPRIIILGGFVTTRCTRVDNCYVVSAAPSGGWSYSIGSDNLIASAKQLSRSPWQPTLDDALPRFNTDDIRLDASQIADLTAIALQALKAN